MTTRDNADAIGDADLDELKPAIAHNLAEVRARIVAAARRAGRDAAEVTLVAVSKTHAPALITAALEAGQRDFGENRVQEALPKIEQLAGSGARWHLIGHLQRNKARRAAAAFDMVQSVDSLRLAAALDQSRAELVPDAPPLPILLQVNISGEGSKEGLDLPGGLENAAQLPALLAEVEQLVALPRLRVEGLMTIAPFVEDQGVIRATFRALRLLRDELARRFPGSWRHLSMGMSGDFEPAIEEGATIVRVGTAIFGFRG